MKTVDRAWFKGILVAFISGGASSIANAVGAMTFDPGHFNMADGLINLVGLVSMNVLVGGVIGVSAYLKQSPLPPSDMPEVVTPPTIPVPAPTPPTQGGTP